MFRTTHDKASRDPADGGTRIVEKADTGEQATRSLSEQSNKVLQDVRELGSIALENVGQTVNRLKDQGRGTIAKGRQRVQQAKGGFETLIADHPMKSLLIALGVGAILGITLRRRNAPAGTPSDGR
jgi:ElaB/YqjD/DUF883 family membrane-anchored ribosome-binding protein